jgi:hypothetical protein
MALDVAAVLTYVWWVMSGDWLFGHYHGPRQLVIAARVLAVLGITAAIAWLIHAVWVRRANIAIIVLLAFLSLPSGLITLEMVSEWLPTSPRSQAPHWKPEALPPQDQPPEP